MLGWSNCLYVSSSGSGCAPCSGERRSLLRLRPSRRRSRAFEHVPNLHIARCPSANRHVDCVAELFREGAQGGHRDRGHLHQAATVDGFDLEDVAQRNDFAGLLVGATAEGGGSSEDALQDQHQATSPNGTPLTSSYTAKYVLFAWLMASRTAICKNSRFEQSKRPHSCSTSA